MAEMALPWQKMFGRRCKTRFRSTRVDFHGRCELAPHGPEIEHALERGMVWVRWTGGAFRLETPHY